MSGPLTDQQFLEWIADRFVYVHGESQNVDFVLRLREIAARAAAPGIDVERLARALDGLGWPLRHRQMTAEWIAAEYARLGEAPGE